MERRWYFTGIPVFVNMRGRSGRRSRHKRQHRRISLLDTNFATVPPEMREIRRTRRGWDLSPKTYIRSCNPGSMRWCRIRETRMPLALSR
jgi:hypothetical protein